MNRLSHIRILAVLCIVAVVPLAAAGQVYIWNGDSPHWNQLSNWSSQWGEPVKTLPNSETHVVVPDSYQGEIIFSDESISIASLNFFGENSVVFSSLTNTTIEINGTLNLGPNTTLADEVLFNLTGAGFSSPVLAVPSGLEGNLIHVADHYQEQSFSLNSRGSCPFFDLTPDPTPPTCNGFEDGIAAVLEPTTGVGPYTYQWIGGPSTREWPNVGAGTYTIIVIDLGQGGLPCNTDVFVNEPGPLTLFSLSQDPPNCFDSCDGQAIPIVIGGNPPYTLTWSSGETGINPTSLCATFSLNIEDSQGCTTDTTIAFLNVPDPISIAADVTSLTCFGFDDGSIDVTASGGTGALDYSWTGPNGFASVSEDISGLEPGDYTVEVEDDNGCLASAAFTVVENPELILSTNVVPNVCEGEALGAIDLTIVGGLAPYGVVWTGPLGFTSNDEDISGLIAGTYEATVTDAAGCVVVVQADVADPPALTATIDVTNLLCFEDNSGEIQATASGGTPGYNYAWTGPNGFVGSGPNLIFLPAGTYTLIVTDNNNCEFITTADVLQPDELTLSFAESPISCNGDFDGEIDLTVSGGTPPYTFSWTGPNAFSSTNEDITGLGNGEYFIAVTDGNGCLVNGSYDLLEPLPIALSAATTNPDCAGEAAGEIDLTITNGTPPYTTEWVGSNGFTSSNEDITNLEAGSYSVEVVDDGGCIATEIYIISEPASLGASFTIEEVSCFGGNDGNITTVPSGGTAPYSFSWTGPNGFASTDQNPSGLAAGDYSLVLSDNNTCEETFVVTILEPTDLTITEVITPVSCFGDADGAIDITVSGATAPYSFSWSGPNGFNSTTQNVAGVAAGDYELEVTDANLCVFATTIQVSEPDELALSFAETPVSCNGFSDGEIDLEVAGGNPPYDYSWTGPLGFTSIDEDITGLASGEYFVEVTDGNGCLVGGSYDLVQPLAIALSAVTTDPACVGGAQGEIDLTVANGVPPYTFSWTGPGGFTSFNEDILNLQAGSYTVEVSDDAGCVQGETFVISDPAPAIASFSVDDVSCFGGSDGTITTTVVGGAAPYIFSWTGPGGFTSAVQNPAGLIAGEYTLQLTDFNGCSDTFIATVGEPTDLNVNESITDATCFGELDGAIEIVLSGANPPFNFAWTGPSAFVSSNQNIAGLQAGNYDLEVTDANLCVFNFSFALNQPEEIQITADITNVLCAGQSTGSIDIAVTGGVPNLNYSWTGPNGFTSATEDISGLEAGNYFVEVTGADGCFATANFEVIEGFELELTLSETDISCFGDGNGSIDASISGGNPPYLISWTGPGGFVSADEDLSLLQAGIYSLEVTDSNECIAFDQVEIVEPDELQNTLVSSNIDCFGENDGEITLNPSGGTAPYSFSWNGPDGFTSSDQNLVGLLPGQYDVEIQDQNGCLFTDGVILTEGAELVVSTSAFDSNCLQADGLAVVSANGGSGILSFSWFDSNGVFLVSNDSLIDVTSGIYEVVVSDELGCSVNELVEISDNSGMLMGMVTTPTCTGGDDGAIAIQFVGGTAPIVYQWSDENGPFSNSQNLSNISAGVYTLSVTDANNCFYTEVFEVEDPDPIVANITFTQISCAGSDGTIVVAVENAQGAFEVNWTGPAGFTATGTSLSDLDGGEYFYTISDSEGCTTNGSVVIDNAPPITIAETSSDILCAGDATGTINIDAAGGLPPLTYDWQGPDNFSSNDEDLTDLLAGDYILTVTDQSNCSETITVSIAEPDSIQADILITQPDCNVSNGSLEAVVSGGVVLSDYQITWLNEQGLILSNSNLLDNLSSGIFTLIVTDDNGCELSEDVTLTNPEGDITPTITPESCPGQMDAAIELEVLDVATPYTVSWIGPDGFTSEDEDIFDLAPGDYTYTITASNGCVFIETLSIGLLDPIDVSATVTNSCTEAATGHITIDVTGGQEPYLVLWLGSNGFIDDDLEIVELPPGSYDLSITDAAGCEFTNSYVIAPTPPIVPELIVTDILCFGENNGLIDLTISGGIPPFTVQWTGADGFESGEEDLTDLAPGEYVYIITDSNNCTAEGTALINEPTVLSIEETVINPGCADEEGTGAITIEPQGGTPEYNVVWTGPDGFSSTDFEIENLQTGVYEYTVADASNCEATNSIEILAAVPIQVSGTVSEPLCFGEASGAIDIVINGGTEPFIFDWSGPNDFVSQEDSIDALEAGDYTLSVTDALGCRAEEEFILDQPEELALNLTPFAASCTDSFDGSIESVVNGGTGDYSYVWTGPNSFISSAANITDLSVGTYGLTVSDENSCQVTGEATVDVLFEVEPNAGADTAICRSELPVILEGSVSGGAFLYWTILGDTIAEGSEVVITDTYSGTTVITLIGSNGICSATDTVSVEILESPDVDAGDDLQVFVEEVFTLGGNPTSTDEVTFSWFPSPTTEFDNTASNPSTFLFESQQFVLIVTDQFGCTSVDSVDVEVLPDLEITSGFTPNGDGFNDFWIIDNIELFPNMIVHVFNRWGVEVFQSQGYNREVAWDGNFNGSPLPSGTYYFTIELNDPRFPDPITGPLTIHR